MADYSRGIWDWLLAKIGNEYGVAGLMGNLQAESGLCPYRVQGDFSAGYTTSIEYTAKVDSGEISEYDFVHNGPGGGGYGLAQWTYSVRKQRLYDMWHARVYPSIGDVNLALNYLWDELCNDYTGVLTVLVNADSVREASDKVLHGFENPADQSVTVEQNRAAMGQAWYDLYATGGPYDPDVPDIPTPGPTPSRKKTMPLWMKYAATRRRF